MSHDHSPAVATCKDLPGAPPQQPASGPFTVSESAAARAAAPTVATGRSLHVEIFHDPDTPSPCQDDETWQLYSFSRRHLSFRDPRTLFPPGTGTLRLMLRSGTAWLLSYFEHGLCQWMLADEPKGSLAGDWRWDGVDLAGVLTWEHPVTDLGPITKQDRRADAAAFTDIYTAWCNGETYGYRITDDNGHDISGSAGLIGTDHLRAVLLEDLDVDDRIASITDPFGMNLDALHRAIDGNRSD